MESNAFILQHRSLWTSCGGALHSRNTARNRSHAWGLFSFSGHLCPQPWRAAQILRVIPAVGWRLELKSVSSSFHSFLRLQVWRILLHSSSFSHKLPRKEHLPFFVLAPSSSSRVHHLWVSTLPLGGKFPAVTLHPPPRADLQWRLLYSEGPQIWLVIRTPGGVEIVGAWAPDWLHPSLWEKGPGILYW